MWHICVDACRYSSTRTRALPLQLPSGFVDRARTGANFGGDVTDQYTIWDRPQNVGHFFMALKPGIFVTEKGFRERMDVLVSRVKANPLAIGADEIFMPGEIESCMEIERRQKGIPYMQSDVDLLAELASEYGVKEMPYSKD